MDLLKSADLFHQFIFKSSDLFLDPKDLAKFHLEHLENETFFLQNCHQI